MNNQTKTEDLLDEMEMIVNTEKDIHTCMVCCAVGDNLIYDEFIGGHVCSACDMKRELGHDFVCDSAPKSMLSDKGDDLR